MVRLTGCCPEKYRYLPTHTATDMLYTNQAVSCWPRMSCPHVLPCLLLGLVYSMKKLRAYYSPRVCFCLALNVYKSSSDSVLELSFYRTLRHTLPYINYISAFIFSQLSYPSAQLHRMQQSNGLSQDGHQEAFQIQLRCGRPDRGHSDRSKGGRPRAVLPAARPIPKFEAVRFPPHLTGSSN